MKNIKDTLFDCRKHWFMSFLGNLIFSLPVCAIFLPVGNQSDYEVNKWYIYMAIVSIILALNQIYKIFEDHDKTIEKMNDEIEKLKEEIGKLKK